MRNFYLTFCSAVLGTILCSCAKDRTVDDFNREKLYTELAELQAVEGLYTGVLISQQNQQVMGAFQVMLRAETVVNPQTNQGRPELAAEVGFWGNKLLYAPTSRSFYQSESGQYEGEIALQAADDASGSASIPGPSSGAGPVVDRLRLSGALRGNVFSGQLVARGYDGFGANFRLVKSGESLESLRKKLGSLPGVGLAQRSYTGEILFAGANRKSINLFLFEPTLSAVEELRSLLVPIKPVVATLDFGDDAQITIDAAFFDVRSRRLRGQNRVANSDLEVRVETDCQFDPHLDQMSCFHTSSGSVMEIRSQLVSVESQDVERPRNEFRRRAAITRTFRGNGVFDTSRPQENVAMEFIAILPPLTAKEEVSQLFVPPQNSRLRVAFIQLPNRTTTSFSLARVNPSTRLLTATEVQRTATRDVTHNLVCRGFSMSETRNNFECDYSNTATNTPGLFQFR